MSIIEKEKNNRVIGLMERKGGGEWKRGAVKYLYCTIHIHKSSILRGIIFERKTIQD